MPVLGNTKVLPEALDQTWARLKARLAPACERRTLVRRAVDVVDRLAGVSVARHTEDEQDALLCAIVRLAVDGPSGDVQQVAGGGPAGVPPPGPELAALPAWT